MDVSASESKSSYQILLQNHLHLFCHFYSAVEKAWNFLNEYPTAVFLKMHLFNHDFDGFLSTG